MEDFQHYPQDNKDENWFSDDVIAICAINATLRVKGVSELYGGIQNAISENLLGKELASKGIKVEQIDEGIHLDVYVIVEYGAKIPETAWDIQEAVKREVETMVDKEVLGVNIHVKGVAPPPTAYGSR